MNSSVFSERLNSAMKKKGLKQVDIIKLAEKKGLKIGKSHISQYVNGKTLPRENILQFLASALDVDSEWLKGVSKNNKIELSNKKFSARSMLCSLSSSWEIFPITLISGYSDSIVSVKPFVRCCNAYTEKDPLNNLTVPLPLSILAISSALNAPAAQ